MIYLFVFILLLIPVVRFDLMQIEKGRQLWLFLCWSVLVLVAGLRYRVGGDTLIYMVWFDTYPTWDDLSYFNFEEAKFNPLWYIFNALTKSIVDDFAFFQIVHAVIVNSVFFYFFKKYTPYYFTAIFVYGCAYYLYFNFEILREVMGICILMLAYPLLEKKNYLLYYILCVAAICFHYSAGVMLFFPLFYLFFKKESFVWTTLGCLCILVLMSFVNIVPLLLSFFVDGQLAVLSEKYFESEVSIGGMVYQFLLCLPTLILLYIHEKNQLDANHGFGRLLMVSAYIYFFSMFINGFWRLSNYFVPFFIIYFINTFYALYEYRYQRQVTSVLMGMTIMIFSFTSFYYYYKDQSDFLPGARFYHIFHPYHSILSPEIDEFRERFIDNYRH